MTMYEAFARFGAAVRALVDEIDRTYRVSERITWVLDRITQPRT